MEIKDVQSLTKALYFRDQFRSARSTALKDAEAFHDILYTVERLGYLLKGTEANMGKYRGRIRAIAEESALAEEIPAKHRPWHTPFLQLYNLVNSGRNDALHQGAFARNLTVHATQLAIVLEDALTNSATKIGDFMVREPVFAFPWQPVSFVRQQMLANSFSYLPTLWETEHGRTWKVLSDFNIARFLRIADDSVGKERSRRLALVVSEAVAVEGLILDDALDCDSERTVGEALELFSGDGRPILVHRPGDPETLVGIVTAYDLL